MPDYDQWFDETEEEGKRELRGEGAGAKNGPRPVVGKAKGVAGLASTSSSDFLAKNIDSYSEFLEERKHPKGIKPTIQDPIMKAILDFDEEKK